MEKPERIGRPDLGRKHMTPTGYYICADGYPLATYSDTPPKDAKKVSKKTYVAAQKERALEQLRKLCPVGSTVYTVLKKVSASGMLRHIALIVIDKGEPRNISGLVSNALDYRWTDGDALVVGGCGMDMGFSVVYNLAAAIWRDAPAEQDRRPGDSRSPGYNLNQKWL